MNNKLKPTHHLFAGIHVPKQQRIQLREMIRVLHRQIRQIDGLFDAYVDIIRPRRAKRLHRVVQHVHFPILCRLLGLQRRQHRKDSIELVGDLFRPHQKRILDHDIRQHLHLVRQIFAIIHHQDRLLGVRVIQSDDLWGRIHIWWLLACN